jgi:glycosyltransferase involved in cell wall biosynthesis
MKNDIIILIPAYKPEKDLIALCQKFKAVKFKKIIVVNDGSGTEFDSIFNELKSIKEIVLLEHTENQGKGAALKTGFRYIIENVPDTAGVITVDADGQHLPDDVKRIAEEMEQFPDSVVLGERSFSKKIPFRSKFGNIATRLMLQIFFKMNITDSQTGLRGIPFKYLERLTMIIYNRYEYEIEMLISFSRTKVDIHRIPIETVYIDNNKSSHFNPLVDSMKIYFVLFRHMLSGMTASIVDYIVFLISFHFLNNTIISTYIGRAFSSVINYSLLKRFVFHSRYSVALTLVLYYIQVIVMSWLVALLVDILRLELGIPLPLSKAIVEICFYFINFFIQKTFIFKSKSE